MIEVFLYPKQNPEAGRLSGFLYLHHWQEMEQIIDEF